MARELEFKSINKTLGVAESVTTGMKLYFGASAATAAIFAEVGVGAPKGSLYISSGGKIFQKTSIAGGDATDWTDGAIAAPITVADIANDAVETAKIKNLQVTGAKMANATVTVTQLANDAVETAKIKNAQVTLAKLAAGVTPSHVVKFAGEITWSGAGATLATAVAGVLATDILVCSIKTAPTQAAYLKSAAATNDTITLVLSAANTGNDAVISYQVLRAAA